MANTSEKIPIVVGVTGHRNIVEEDKPELKNKVRDSLKEIKELCAHGDDGSVTPVIMLNAFAQGADMLCAEVAFELGIEVYAALPCALDKYITSFDNDDDKDKLREYLDRAKRVFVVPDIEQNRAWLNIDDDSYEYRQLGIYMAEHSHILLALWDGKAPKTKFGCGTVEVIQFALEHKFLDKDNMFKPGMINDSAVIWIKSRRQGDNSEADIKRKWLFRSLAMSEEKGEEYNEYIVSDEAPKFLKNIIAETVEYNSVQVSVPDDSIKLWKQVDELDEYRKGVRYHYAKSDELSYSRNQKYYNRLLLAIAVLGTLVALTFLIYDDAGLPYLIFPCSALLCAILSVCVIGRKRKYHRSYIKYRAFAEALRIQFYLSLCVGEKEVIANVCDLYSWTQKVDMVWIDKAIQALAVVMPSHRPEINTDSVIDAWIGNNVRPTGQLRYHTGKLPTNRKKSKTYKRLSSIFQTVAVAVYFVIFAMEVVTCILSACGVSCFWSGQIFGGLMWRNFAAIILGVFAAGSLLLASYWGKLTYDRKADDNEKMVRFYSAALERWNQVKDHVEEVESFVTEIAREEIVENGIWCSYVNENGLEVTI